MTPLTLILELDSSLARATELTSPSSPALRPAINGRFLWRAPSRLESTHGPAEHFPPRPDALIQRQAVKDANGLPLAYVCAWTSAIRREYLTPAEALQIAEAIARLPELLIPK